VPTVKPESTLGAVPRRTSRSQSQCRQARSIPRLVRSPAALRAHPHLGTPRVASRGLAGFLFPGEDCRAGAGGGSTGRGRLPAQ